MHTESITGKRHTGIILKRGFFIKKKNLNN